MELNVICDADSFVLDESAIEISPIAEQLAIEVGNVTDLTFETKGLVN